MKKVLLIDDSSLSRNILKNALSGTYTLVEASDGISGLETYFLERPDLVILDLTMPGINGLEVLTKLREIDPSARIIIGTADVQEYSRTQANLLGASGFLMKPFNAQNVRETVEEVLEKGQE